MVTVTSAEFIATVFNNNINSDVKVYMIFKASGLKRHTRYYPYF